MRPPGSVIWGSHGGRYEGYWDVPPLSLVKWYQLHVSGGSNVAARVGSHFNATSADRARTVFVTFTPRWTETRT